MAAGLLVSLPQMVELAIGSPECGAVNFNLLSAALQAIIQQLHLHEHMVDFRGPELEKIQGLVSTAKPGIAFTITEATDVESTTLSDGRHSVEIGKTEPRRNSREPPNAGAITKNEKVIVIEPSRNESSISHVPQIVVGVSRDLFLQINQEVEELKSKMTEMLNIAHDDTILDAMKANGHDKVTPVIDMWQALSIANRMENAEKGMEKLARMFESLIYDLGAAKDDSGGIDLFAQINLKFEELEKRIEAVAASGPRGSVGHRGSTGGGGGHRGSGGGSTTPGAAPQQESFQNDYNDVGELEAEIDQLKARIKAVETDLASALKGIKGKNIADLFKDIEDLKTKVSEQKETSEAGGAGAGGGMDEAMFNELQGKFSDFANKLDNLDETLSQQISKLQEQLLTIEKELGALLEASNTKPDVNNDAASVSDLFNKILKLQDDLDKVSKTTDRMNDEEEERTMIVDQLTEQIEVLKTTKADREDLEDALADKADTQQVNRKVSTMQFDAACEDLTKHIEDTMTKLTEQEDLWRNTLLELHTSIGSKLDKQEFDPLREFVNKKIKNLQQRLKALLAMKQEQEAAGTKSKILKNVNCISCNKDVIMYKDNKFSTFPTPQSMPGSRSIKPYITYELDAVRKQQRSLPQGRNMNNLETALHDEKSKKEKIIPEKPIPSGHLCNRYCGGSHTMTQPNQRVAHLGHFLNQWGPQAISLDEGQVMGTDGQMYKARDAGGDAPKSPVEGSHRMSAQMQTDEPPERVQRMSSTLEAIKRERAVRRSLLSKQVTVGEGEALESVKEESEKGDKKTARTSLRRSVRKSTDSVKMKPTADDSKPRTSGSRNSTSRQSLKKSQISLKRLSQSATKVPTVSREGDEGASESPAEGEGEAAPAEAEAPAEGAEGAAEAAAEEPPAAD